MGRRRRQLLLSAGVFLVAPIAAIGQRQPKLWRVGFLSAGAPDAAYESRMRSPFMQKMRELGYVEGESVQYEWRTADGNYERLPALAAELVRLKLDVIVAAGGTPSIRAAQRATATIPIVMYTVGDPVGSGFAASLSRPGGNITGSSLGTSDYAPKFLELLRAVLPRLSRVAVLVNRASGQRVTADSLERIAPKLGIQILPVDARTLDDISRGFDTMSKQRVDALVITPDPVFSGLQRRIAEFAITHRLPSISYARSFAEGGCLMSYGQDFSDYARHAAIYVDKILKGARPGDLPIEQPVKFELVINRHTANALEITIPKELLFRADKVIE